MQSKGWIGKVILHLLLICFQILRITVVSLLTDYLQSATNKACTDLDTENKFPCSLPVCKPVNFFRCLYIILSYELHSILLEHLR